MAFSFDGRPIELGPQTRQQASGDMTLRGVPCLNQITFPINVQPDESIFTKNVFCELNFMGAISIKLDYVDFHHRTFQHLLCLSNMT